MKKKIGLAIIGTGNIAKFHANCIRKIKNSTLKGVYSRSGRINDELIKEFGCKIFDNIDKLLEVDGIDLVCVCNESGLHGETIKKIAMAGKNVLCEKPLETSIEKIADISQVAKSSGIKIGCVFQNRQNPEYQKLKNYINSGVLGKLLLCQTSINWYRPPSYYNQTWRGSLYLDGGAAFINQGIHTIDLMLDLMGEVKKVVGFIDTLHHEIEGEDVGVASIRFSSGALGTLSAGTALYPGQPESISIYGTLGNICFSGGKIISSSVDFIENELNEIKSDPGSGSSDPMAISDQFHIETIVNMINSIIHDKNPDVGIEEASKSVAFINSIYESNKIN